MICDALFYNLGQIVVAVHFIRDIPCQCIQVVVLNFRKLICKSKRIFNCFTSTVAINDGLLLSHKGKIPVYSFKHQKERNQRSVSVFDFRNIIQLTGMVIIYADREIIEVDAELDLGHRGKSGTKVAIVTVGFDVCQQL